LTRDFIVQATPCSMAARIPKIGKKQGGGMGVVCNGEHARQRRFVVLKLMPVQAFKRGGLVVSKGAS
jgi:hypothetical protein